MLQNAFSKLKTLHTTQAPVGTGHYIIQDHSSISAGASGSFMRRAALPCLRSRSPGRWRSPARPRWAGGSHRDLHTRQPDITTSVRTNSVAVLPSNYFAAPCVPQAATAAGRRRGGAEMSVRRSPTWIDPASHTTARGARLSITCYVTGLQMRLHMHGSGSSRPML